MVGCRVGLQTPLHTTHMHAATFAVTFLSAHVIFITYLLAVCCMSHQFKLGAREEGGLIAASTFAFLAFAPLAFAGLPLVLTLDIWV